MNIGHPQLHQTTSLTLEIQQELCRFHGLDAPIADRLAKNASFAVALAVERVACHAAILRVAKCNRVLAAKSLPCLQHQVRCQMHPLLTYIR